MLQICNIYYNNKVKWNHLSSSLVIAMIVYQFMFLFSVDSAFMQGVKKVFGIGEEQKELVDPYFVFSFAGKEVATTS